MELAQSESAILLDRIFFELLLQYRSTLSLLHFELHGRL
jgi:hypothetical protein